MKRTFLGGTLLLAVTMVAGTAAANDCIPFSKGKLDTTQGVNGCQFHVKASTDMSNACFELIEVTNSFAGPILGGLVLGDQGDCGTFSSLAPGKDGLVHAKMKNECDNPAQKTKIALEIWCQDN